MARLTGQRSQALRRLWQQPRFPTLLAARLTSQTSDGLFQASLVGAIVFDPARRAGPTQVATGFVVLLLPYSLVGPFAGVFLDRWRRQRVLVRGALTRSGLTVLAALLLSRDGPTAVSFVLAALAVLSVNRFYLAALSAALPSVVGREQLVLANAVSPTAGTLVTIVGGLAGLGVRAMIGSGAGGDAVVALLAAAGYVAAAAVGARLPVDALGPARRDARDLRGQLVSVAHGLLAGTRHLRDRPAAAWVLAVISGQRLLYGLWTIMTVLLYRNDFTSDGPLRAGLVGLGQVVTASGVGLVGAAAVTPWLTARLGTGRWIVVATGAAAVGGLALEAPFAMPAQLGCAALLGFTAQATKVCVDTVVQAEVADEFRGRVFAVYDTLFNVSFVAAAVVAALTLPATGRSMPAVLAMTAGYLTIAAAYAGAHRPRRRSVVAEQPG